MPAVKPIQYLYSPAYIWHAIASCRMFDLHDTLRDWFRADARAGNSIAISTAIMPITTSNSTSVKARLPRPQLQRRGGAGMLDDMLTPVRQRRSHGRDHTRRDASRAVTQNKTVR